MNGPPQSRLTRRGVLSVLGTGALAGCSVFDSGDDDPTISTYDLPEIDRETLPEPVLAPDVPVDIAPSYFETLTGRVTALLSQLPTRLGPSEIPNGHIRQQLTDAAGEATRKQEAARTARTDLVALQSLRQARAEARYAAAGWGFADRDLSKSTLQTEHSETVSAATSARNAHEYLGTDPVRAAIVHARIESAFQRATSEPGHMHTDSDLLAVAEWGERAESAQAALDDAEQLTEQFTESLPSETESIKETLRRAAETLHTDVETQRSGLTEPTESEWDTAGRVRRELWREIEDVPATVDDAIGPASAVVEATTRLAQTQAFEELQDRIAAGDLTGVETAEQFRARRQAAYDGIDTALESAPNADLARAVLSDVSWRVTSADRELSRYNGDVRAQRLAEPVAGYTIVAAVARATPGACQKTVEVLTEPE